MNASGRAHSNDTLDIEANHTVGLGERHEVIWGLGYRFIDNTIEQTAPIHRVRNGDFALQHFSAFVQDDFRLVPTRLTLTGGLKVEHNDFTGLELQPSLRVVFKPHREQTAWAAVSRAVRTPSALEGRDLFAVAVGEPFPGSGRRALSAIGGRAIPPSRARRCWPMR